MNGGVELSFACGAVRALTPGAALVLRRDSVKNDWEAGGFVSRRQAKVEQLEDGTVRIESLGQNATGVFTNKWEWLEKGGVLKVDHGCKLSLHAKWAPAARVHLKGVRKQARVLRTWRCDKANLVALVQEMHDLAEETEKQTDSHSKVFWLGKLLDILRVSACVMER